MLVNCSCCRIPLQLPEGARVIRCAVCQAVTRIADPRSLPPSHNQHSLTPAQSPYGQMPPGQPAGVHGRKKAVVCGVSYQNSRYELKGCVNDAKCMKYLLVNRFKFPEASILMLTGNFVTFVLFVLFCLVARNRGGRKGKGEIIRLWVWFVWLLRKR